MNADLTNLFHVPLIENLRIYLPKPAIWWIYLILLKIDRASNMHNLHSSFALNEAQILELIYLTTSLIILTSR